MGVGFYSAMTGMKLKEMELEVVAHNLANVNTNGFREQNLTFQSVMSKNDPGASPEDAPPMTVEPRQSINFTTGPVAQTNNYLDLALQGEGFFEVRNDQGPFYTRNGNFTLNSEGELVTMTGAKVMGVDGVIKIGSGGKVEVSQTGDVVVDGEVRGRLKIVDFEDRSSLTLAGSTMLKAGAGAQSKTPQGVLVLQGKVEGSNASMIANMVKLIEISKQYQSYHKILQMQSKIEQDSAATIGRLS